VGPSPVKTNVDVARRWKDVLVRAGISVEYAWKFGLNLQREGFDETNAMSLSEEILNNRIGMSDASQRRSTLSTIQEIAQELSAIHVAVTADDGGDEEGGEQTSTGEQYQHALVTWRNLFMKAKLGKLWGLQTAIRYARSLARQGWDEWNLEDMTEDDLIHAGIDNPTDREVVLELVERELKEAEIHPEQVSMTSAVKVTKEDVDEIREAKKEIAQSIEAIERFQAVRQNESSAGLTE